MTLWQRTADGGVLCVGVAIASLLAERVMAEGNQTAQRFAAGPGLFACAFGLLVFGPGILMIIGGAPAHLREVWKRRH